MNEPVSRGGYTMQPVTLRLSRSAKFLGLLLPYSLALILLPFVGGAALHSIPDGAPLGVVVGLVGGLAVLHYGRTRLARTYMKLDSDSLTLSNGGDQPVSIGWDDVEQVERRLKYFGFLSQRGVLLCIVPKSASGISPQYVNASWQATSDARRAVVSALTELSAAHGFTLDPTLGDGFGFTRRRQARE